MMLVTHLLYAAPIHPMNILILYDSSGAWGWSGYLHAVFLSNLLGHFESKVQLMPVESYQQGKLDQYALTFYLGNSYDNPLPLSFIKDVMHTQQTVVWFRYNLWQLQRTSADFTGQFGFSFDAVDRAGYDRVVYHGTTFTRNLADVDLGHVLIHDATRVSVFATAQQTGSHQEIPYIIRSGNFWYVADIPFTYLTENDRYLVFSDLLYDILRVPAVEQKRALLRLEDIDPTYDVQILKLTADYLFKQHVPFAVSVIPYYKDPLGYFTRNGSIAMNEAPEFIDALKYMQSRGGTLLLHGYTHQYAAEENPYHGISGEDYEFYRVIINKISGEYVYFQSIPEESKDWVADRVQSALALFSDAKLDVSIWETPHYTASALAYQYFADQFGVTIGRLLYFDKLPTPHHGAQFFPYVIRRDAYGQKVIPENLGCLAPVQWFNFPVRTVDDILTTAKKNLVLRDAWASMYYHPYLGLAYLQQLIPAIKELGYDFIAISPDLI